MYVRRFPGIVNPNIPFIPSEVIYRTPVTSHAVDVTEYEISYTVSNNPARCLLVLVSSIQKVSGVTYNGISMTEWIQKYSQGYASIFGLLNPPSGEHSVIVEFSSFSHIMVGVIELYGVNQSNPYSSDYNIPTAPDVDLSFELDAGDLMITCLNYWSNSNPVTPDPGQTSVFELSSDGAWRGASHLKTGSGTVNIGYSDLDGSFPAVIVGVKVNAT